VRFAAVVLLSAGAASAQVSAPLLGWMPSGTQIRPMNGLPAAAALGRPANVGHELTHIAVSPSQDYVLASDARTGETLLIATSAATGVSTTTLDTPVKPDQIVTSPRGSAAVLWVAAAAQFEILSGLPAAPAISQIDASLIKGAPSAIAVSDDGQWMAAASSTGVYQWGPDGAPHQLYGGSDASALAFFAGSSDLVVATSSQLLSISGAISGSASSVLYQGSFSPVGLATSSDNKEIVLADRTGRIYSINAATQAPWVVDCQCVPTGVFGLGGAIFRLTGSTIGAIKLVDAAAGAILAVPGDSPKITRRMARPAQTTVALPTFTMNLSPTPTGYLQQPAMTITTSSAASSEIDGYVVLNFTSGSSTAGYSSVDGTIQFSTGGTTVTFAIPAGSTQAIFSGAPSVSFSTGTTAGTITLTANVSVPTPVSAVAVQTIVNKPTWPMISKVQLMQTKGGVTVVVTGFSSTDDMISATFLFALTSDATITQNDLTVNVSTLFQTYYLNSASYPTGGEFTLTVPFAVTGNPADMVGVAVTMINGVSSSTPVNSQ
jgi:hypothetical protein